MINFTIGCARNKFPRMKNFTRIFYKNPSEFSLLKHQLTSDLTAYLMIIKAHNLQIHLLCSTTSHFLCFSIQVLDSLLASFALDVRKIFLDGMIFFFLRKLPIELKNRWKKAHVTQPLCCGHFQWDGVVPWQWSGDETTTCLF